MNLLQSILNLGTTLTSSSLDRAFYTAIHIGLITYGLIHLLIAVIAWRESLNARRQIHTQTGVVLTIIHVINIVVLIILLVITIEALR